MRLESAGPRTWLLATVAGWALLALILAVAGMGGRIEPLASDEETLEPLPSLPPATEGMVEPLASYGEISRRPLFSDDRKPKPFSLQGEESEATDSAFDYVLTSVLITPGLRMAILQPADGSESVRVKLDEAPKSHPAWRLVELDVRAAVFEGPEGRRTMALRVFDGHGGRPPTEVAVRRPDAAGTRTAPAMAEGEPAGPAPSAVADANGKQAESQPDQATPATTPESQMEAIRQRIQARRAALREQAQNRQSPQPPPQPPAPPSDTPPSPNPPAESQ
ncbi:general secretion pathway protein GspN [Marilutibacter alkalisoli]|uniref:General secretion pathway protein GspN n=1 Tax=Marilutibacter alkalisoli TaxID=2591633 RepID=A0A514BUJ4_9GAMM|nr:general secretion pathway protein GspN [Lysobacter alkalisoli]QDH70985.1 general secretion pathway protein GspN [Lysobacter alkalisoli]